MHRCVGIKVRSTETSREMKFRERGKGTVQVQQASREEKSRRNLPHLHIEFVIPLDYVGVVLN